MTDTYKERATMAETIIATTEVPLIGRSGSDWEAVGGFRYDRHAGWQQVAAEYANEPDVTTLYRKRDDGSPRPPSPESKP
jgi:hypothetical protein